MFTINLEDGREAPSKVRKKGAKLLEFLVHIYVYRNRFSLLLNVASHYKAGSKEPKSTMGMKYRLKKIFFKI